MAQAGPVGSRAGGLPQLFVVLRIAVVIAVLLGCVFLVRGLSLRRLVQALAAASLPGLFAGGVLAFLLLPWKALRLRVMLAGLRAPGFGPIFRYTVLASAASTLLPARAGEFLRVFLLVRRHGVPLSTMTAVALSEKVLDVLGMLVVVSPLPWLLPGLPPWVASSLQLAAAIGTAVWLAAAVGSRHAGLGPRLRGFASGFAALSRPRLFALSVLISLGMWATDALAVFVVLRAMGIEVPAGAALLTLFLVNMAISIPAAPTQAGTFELGAVAALVLLGVPSDKALAFALVYHAIQAVPMALIGLIELRLILSVLRERSAADEATATDGPKPVEPPALPDVLR